MLLLNPFVFFLQTYLRISGGFYRFLGHSIMISQRYLFTLRTLSSNTIPKLYYNVITQHFITILFRKIQKTKGIYHGIFSHFTPCMLAHIFSIQFSLAFFHQSN